MLDVHNPLTTSNTPTPCATTAGHKPYRIRRKAHTNPSYRVKTSKAIPTSVATKAKNICAAAKVSAERSAASNGLYSFSR